MILRALGVGTVKKVCLCCVKMRFADVTVSSPRQVCDGSTPLCVWCLECGGLLRVVPELFAPRAEDRQKPLSTCARCSGWTRVAQVIGALLARMSSVFIYTMPISLISVPLWGSSFFGIVHGAHFFVRNHSVNASVFTSAPLVHAVAPRDYQKRAPV